MKKTKIDHAQKLIAQGARLLSQTHPVNQNRPLWPPEYAQDTPEALFRFLTECCWTQNEADRKVELIPKADYIRYTVHQWHDARQAGETLIIEKSRRMLLSWVLRGCELWSLGRQVEKGIIAGLDYTKADEHVWRIWWLYHQLRTRRPELNLAPPTPREGNPAAQQLGQVILPNSSIVEHLNQESLSFQGTGFTWVTMEEFSRYRNCDQMYAQAIMVTQGKATTKGGNVVIVTNASPNKAWQQLKAPGPISCFPRHGGSSVETGQGVRGTEPNAHPDPKNPRNQESQNPPHEPSQPTNLQTLKPPPGIEFRPGLPGRRYLRIHYTADPGKDQSWVQREKPNVPAREWQREMEMQEDVYEGEPVFAEYSDRDHCPRGTNPLPVRLDGKLIGGWDCGQTINPAFVLLQVSRHPWQVQGLVEVIPPGPEPMSKFALRVKQVLDKLLTYRAEDVEHWGDTTMTIRNGSNFETAQQAARRHGIRIRPGTNDWQSRYNAVSWLLTDKINERYQRFVIDGGRCPVLREGFKGAYRFDTKDDCAQGPEREIPERPRKDGYSHVHDALQYAACRVHWYFKNGIPQGR